MFCVVWRLGVERLVIVRNMFITCKYLFCEAVVNDRVFIVSEERST